MIVPGSIIATLLASSGPGTPVVSYLASYEAGAPADPNTFTACNIGNDAEKVIIVVVTGDATLDGIDTITVAGYYGNPLVNIGGSGFNINSIYSFKLPSGVGTTADIIVDTKGGSAAANLGISVYVSYNLPIPRATTADRFRNSDPGTLVVTTSNAGAFVGGAYNASNSTWTWTHVGSTITEDYDSQIGSDAAAFSSASKALPSGTHTIIADVVSSTSHRGAGVVFTEDVYTDNWPYGVICGAYNNTVAASTTRTFTGAPINAASSDRVVAVALSWEMSAGSPTITSALIGAVTATVATQIANAGNTGSGIIYASVPTGTTATIAVTFSANVVTASILVVSMYNLQSSTPTDTDFQSFTGSNFTTTLTGSIGGIVIGSTADTAAGSAVPTWSGDIVDYNVYSNPGGMDIACFFTNITTSGDKTYSGTWNNTAGTIAVAHWR